MSLLLDLWRMGYHAIPCSRTAKIPLVKWKPYQFRRPSEGETLLWEYFFKGVPVGVVTGRAAGLVVIDVDGETGVRSMRTLPSLPDPRRWVRTPRGFHIYLRHPGRFVSTRAGVLPGVDVRADGGFVVAPGSVTRSGRYTWGAAPFTPEELPLFDVVRFSELAGEEREREGGRVSTTATITHAARGEITSQGAGRSASVRERVMVGPGGRGGNRRVQAWARAALEGEIQRLHQVPLGPGNAKNCQLARAAFRLGQIIGAGLLKEGVVRASLISVWVSRWGKRESEGERVIRNGLLAGRASPRSLTITHEETST